MFFTYRRFPVSFLRLTLAFSLEFWLLITLLVLSSGPAYAEWVSIGGDAEGMTAYVDPNTIRRKGDLVKQWELYDFKTNQAKAGDSYFSGKAQIEYDCAEERRRTLAYTSFSGNMGRGKVVSTNSDEHKWTPVAPDSIGQILWTFACEKQ